jgi:hypothetical protein
MSSGRETDDEKAGVRITKAGHGTAPISLVLIGSPPDHANVFAMGHEAWAAEAIYDLLVQLVERAFRVRRASHVLAAIIDRPP